MGAVMTDLFPETIPQPAKRRPPRVLMRISETDIGHTGETDGPVNVRLFCQRETCHHETGWLRFDSAAQAKAQPCPKCNKA